LTTLQSEIVPLVETMVETASMSGADVDAQTRRMPLSMSSIKSIV
jgi:hypothetical protein